MFARRLTTSVAPATLVALASFAGEAAASASPALDQSGHYSSDAVPTADHGRGATVPFTEYPAVGATSNGTVIGPSDNLYTLPTCGSRTPLPTGSTSTAA